MAGWFTDGPEDLFKMASAAINRWWDSIDGEPDGGIVCEVAVTVILCHSPDAMRAEYLVRHGAEMPIEAAGMTWSDGMRTEIYLPAKQVAAGVVVNMWALGHEVAHCLPIANPDGVENAEFYDA